MAFVFRSERDNGPRNENPVLGPGTYLGHIDHTPSPAYAPFLSM